MADFKAIMAEIKQPLWDNWYIVEELGSGASSVVYRIEAKRENRTDVSALKVEPITLDDVLYHDPQKRASILEKKRQAAVNETSIMYKLKKCPYIVGYEDENILKLEHTEGYVLLIRMEFLTCLQDKVKKGAFDRSEANVIKLATEIGSGIQAAHKLGVIHRDVKPANFFVSDDGTYKLGDFNISKSSASARSFAGTEGYIAPEIYKAKQSVDNTYTKQADIYSFGICLYQLMNDFCFPFEDNCLAEEAIDRRMNGEPLPPPRNASPAFARVILRACAYEPGDRYQTMDEFLADIRGLGFSAAAPAPSQSYPSAPASFGQGSLNNPFSQSSSQYSTARGGASDKTTYAADEAAPSNYGQPAPNFQQPAPNFRQPAANFQQPASGYSAPAKKSKLPAVLAAIVGVGVLGGAVAFLATRGGSSGDKSSADYPSGAEKFGGHHYMYYSEHMNWKDAEAFCVEKGGHLVAINSKDEQEFISEYAKKEASNTETKVWIGAYRVKDDMDTWYWTNGDKFGYTNWGRTESYDGTIRSFPQNIAGNCYYACHIISADRDYVADSWADFPNTGDSGSVKSIGFICEWD